MRVGEEPVRRVLVGGALCGGLGGGGSVSWAFLLPSKVCLLSGWMNLTRLEDGAARSKSLADNSGCWFICLVCLLVEFEAVGGRGC